MLLKPPRKVWQLATMTAAGAKAAARCVPATGDHRGFLRRPCERPRRAAARRLKAVRFPTPQGRDPFACAAAASVHQPLLLDSN